MKRVSLFLVILFIFTGFSCTKKGDNTSQSSSSSSGFEELITIKKGEKLVLDSPKKFVELWILYNLEQKKWFQEIANNTNISTNEEGEAKMAEFLEEKKKEFYQSFGITEKDFVNYSMNNIKKIQTFLEENPEYKRAYEKSME
ncbi:MAG: hypothetical protein ACP5Q5_09040 [Brevinematia bacterium]